jgi:hypothetical protein
MFLPYIGWWNKQSSWNPDRLPVVSSASHSPSNATPALGFVWFPGVPKCVASVKHDFRIPRPKDVHGRNDLSIVDWKMHYWWEVYLHASWLLQNVLVLVIRCNQWSAFVAKRCSNICSPIYWRCVHLSSQRRRSWSLETRCRAGQYLRINLDCSFERNSVSLIFSWR